MHCELPTHARGTQDNVGGKGWQHRRSEPQNNLAPTAMLRAAICRTASRHLARGISSTRPVLEAYHAASPEVNDAACGATFTIC